VDIGELPEDVNIENVEDANIAIYEIDYNDTTDSSVDSKQVFVITYSSEMIDDQGDLIVSQEKRQFLHFGSEGETSDSFLKTATGVVGGLESGYIMMRSGGITGVSTNLDVLNSAGGDIEIIIYKNGEAIRFGNTIDAASTGVAKDYDVQSRNVVTFQPGDVISAYVSTPGSASVESVITMIEITTVD